MIKQICKWSFVLLLMPLLTIQQTLAQDAYNLFNFAGQMASGFEGDGGSAANAKFNLAVGMAIDATGNLYVADAENFRVRKIDATTGIITTVAGIGQRGSSGDGGLATQAMTVPFDVALDAANNLYILEHGEHRIRKVDAITGIITTIAGNGVEAYSGDGGPAAQAQLGLPSDIEIDAAGNIYIADFSNHRIRKVDAATGIINTIAGTGVLGTSGDGGLATDAQLYGVLDLALDATGNIYLLQSNHQIRRIDAATGVITLFAGVGTMGYSGDGGPAVNAQFSLALGIAADAQGDVYIADNLRLRKINACTGIVTTIAGDGNKNFTTDEGDATTISIGVMKLLIDNNDNIYLSEANRIRKLTTTHTDGLIVASHAQAVANSTIKVPIRAKHLKPFVGFQFDMHFPTTQAQFKGITNINPKLTEFNGDNYYEMYPGQVRAIWVESNLVSQTFQNNEVLFEVELQIPASANVGDKFAITFDNVMVADEYASALKVGHKQGCVHIVAASKISGIFKTSLDQPVKGVQLTLSQSGNDDIDINVNADGSYSLTGLLPRDYTLTPSKGLENTTNGVDVADVISVRRHILQKEILDSPYKVIAADVDLSQNINIADMLLIRKMALGMPVTLTKSWRFIPASYTFVDPANPLAESFPSSYVFTTTSNDVTEDFISIKVGDVNATADPSLRTTAQAVELSMPAMEAMNGDIIRVPVTVSAHYSQIVGLQGSLEFDPKVLQYQGIEAAALPIKANQHLNANNAAQGVISFLYDHPQGNSDSFESGQVLYYLIFKAIGNAGQTATIQLTSNQTKATAYNQNLQQASALRLSAGKIKLREPAIVIFPNPAKIFNVQFDITTNESQVTFTLQDQQGKVVNSRAATFAQGQHTVSFEPNVIAGNYFLTIETNQYKITKKVMIK